MWLCRSLIFKSPDESLNFSFFSSMRALELVISKYLSPGIAGLLNVDNHCISPGTPAATASEAQERHEFLVLYSEAKLWSSIIKWYTSRRRCNIWDRYNSSRGRSHAALLDVYLDAAFTYTSYTLPLLNEYLGLANAWWHFALIHIRRNIIVGKSILLI